MRQTSQKAIDRSLIEKSFNDVYTKESDAIFRFCINRVSDRDQALDLTQETFTKYWKALLDGDVVDYPRTFLFTIARNSIIDWYRKKKSISLESLTDPETDEPYEPLSDDAANQLRLGAEGRFLVSKIHELGVGYRDAVYLRYVEGLSPPEIADILKLSINATSVRINRGIEELRRITGYDIEIRGSGSDTHSSQTSSRKHER